jgi:hypothetical protein
MTDCVRQRGVGTPGQRSGARCVHRVGALIAIMLLYFGLASPRTLLAAQETETLTVRGRIVNGTSGGQVPVGQPVRVIALGTERVQGSWEAPVREDGSYAVAEAIRIPGATYAVGIEYAGGTYLDRVEVPPDSTAAVQDLTVYESVAVDPGIRFEQSALVLASPNAERGTLEATEVHSLVNPTDVTFIPSAQGPGGPAGLLVFPLPAGAVELTPLMGIEPGQIAQIDRGFASLMPIYPGRTDLSFRYRFPYEASTFHLERTVRYPTALYRVLASESDVTLRSPQLPEITRADIGDRSFQTVSGGPFDRGTVIAVDVAGLPTRGFTLASFPLWTITAAGALAGFAIILMALRRAAPVTADRMVPRDEEAIIDRLLVLERDHAEGLIDEEAYREGRQALVATAITLAPTRVKRSNGGTP